MSEATNSAPSRISCRSRWLSHFPARQKAIATDLPTYAGGFFPFYLWKQVKRDYDDTNLSWFERTFGGRVFGALMYAVRGSLVVFLFYLYPPLLVPAKFPSPNETLTKPFPYISPWAIFHNSLPNFLSVSVLSSATMDGMYLPRSQLPLFVSCTVCVFSYTFQTILYFTTSLVCSNEVFPSTNSLSPFCIMVSIRRRRLRCRQEHRKQEKTGHKCHVRHFSERFHTVIDLRNAAPIINIIVPRRVSWFR